MHFFLRIKVTFYDAVCNIHDVIETPNPFPYTENSWLSVLEIIKLNKSDVERQIEYGWENPVGRNDNFLAKARKLSFLQISLDIFDIRQHYIRILYSS